MPHSGDASVGVAVVVEATDDDGDPVEPVFDAEDPVVAVVAADDDVFDVDECDEDPQPARTTTTAIATTSRHLCRDPPR